MLGLLLVLLVASVRGVPQQEKGTVVIGILTVPAETDADCITAASLRVGGGGQIASPVNSSTSQSCFHAYYPEWVAMAGARVVPVPYDTPLPQLTELFGKLNGFLFTGGELSIRPNTTYYLAAKKIFELSKEAMDKRGEVVPLWGTCMGFQMLCVLGAGDNYTVLEHGTFDSDNLSLPLDLTPQASSSKMFDGIPPSTLAIYQKEPVTTNLHHDGVTPATFKGNEQLASFYNVLSTNVDRKGKGFVSTIEGQNYPVYATQWHPERNSFEWVQGERINHSRDAVVTGQWMANVFVEQARKNSHRFGSQAELEQVLIYRHQPTYLGDSVQIYLFN